MSLVPWNPFRDIDNIGREINSFFDYPAKLFAGHSPRVDVYQTEDEVVVKAEIPGVSREDLSLYVDDRSVRISGETRREESTVKTTPTGRRDITGVSQGPFLCRLK